MELQGFHYYKGKYNSAQEHSQETQISIHPNFLSPTRQENTILFFYAAARFLGITLIHTRLPFISNLIYIYIYIYVCQRQLY